MSAEFENQSSGLSGPFVGATALTPSDELDLAQPTRALWVGVAGDLAVTTVAGTQVTFRGFGPGWLPGRIRRLHATGTTASGVVGVW